MEPWRSDWTQSNGVRQNMGGMQLSTRLVLGEVWMVLLQRPLIEHRAENSDDHYSLGDGYPRGTYAFVRTKACRCHIRRSSRAFLRFVSEWACAWAVRRLAGCHACTIQSGQSWQPTFEASRQLAGSCMTSNGSCVAAGAHLHGRARKSATNPRPSLLVSGQRRIPQTPKLPMRPSWKDSDKASS